MSLTLILSISDYQPLRGFIPNGVEDSRQRMEPALATRVWSWEISSERRELQEKTQHFIHGINEPQPHLNAWYNSNIRDCKKVLDGIVNLINLKRPNFFGDIALRFEEGTFSKTLHYLAARKYLTQEESDHYHQALSVVQYFQVTVSLGLQDNWMDNISAIFFSVKFSKPDPAEEARYLSASLCEIQGHMRKELGEKKDNTATYMTSDGKRACISIAQVKLFLNAMLRADWKEWRPFSNRETNQIDKESFAKTISLLGERKLLTQEETDHYAREFFNGASP